mmetsp:Transcript_30983/g.92150  ORF Transcript_30983/g.92150 Transcript_30983/m.92150 type:complete len:337 (-) Transcript_30983:1735-2745(-)
MSRRRCAAPGVRSWLVAFACMSASSVIVAQSSDPLGDTDLAKAELEYSGLPTNLGVMFTVCPGASWQNLQPFEINWKNVSDIANWTNNDFWDYVGNDVIPRSAASIAFLALAVCMLIGFLTWRLVRCSMQCCCQKCVGSNLTHEVIGSRAMFWVKVVGILAVLGVLACGIAGLVLSFPPDGNVMQLAWVSAGNLRDYIAQINVRLTAISNGLLTAGNAASGILEVFQRTGRNALTDILSSASTMLNTVGGAMQPIINSISDIIQDYDDAYESQYENIMNIWNIFVLVGAGVTLLTIGYSLVSISRDRQGLYQSILNINRCQILIDLEWICRLVKPA